MRGISRKDLLVLALLFMFCGEKLNSEAEQK